MIVNKADAACGMLFALIGLGFAASAAQKTIGTPAAMGAGFFPLCLGIVLIILGILIAVKRPKIDIGTFAATAFPRGLCIIAAPVVFGLTARGLGFVPSIFIATLIASFASERMSYGASLGIAAAVTVFASATLVYGLNLPFAYFGAWVTSR